MAYRTKVHCGISGVSDNFFLKRHDRFRHLEHKHTDEGEAEDEGDEAGQ